MGVVCFVEIEQQKMRAFRGRVQFTDLFGKEICAINLTISDPVTAGVEAMWNGTVKYNQFIPQQQNLRNAELKDMKVVWLPASILFADGSTLGET